MRHKIVHRIADTLVKIAAMLYRYNATRLRNKISKQLKLKS